jgi:hypothetical protein
MVETLYTLFDIAWVYMFCKWYPGKLGAEVSKLKRL